MEVFTVNTSDVSNAKLDQSPSQGITQNDFNLNTTYFISQTQQKAEVNLLNSKNLAEVWPLLSQDSKESNKFANEYFSKLARSQADSDCRLLREAMTYGLLPYTKEIPEANKIAITAYAHSQDGSKSNVLAELLVDKLNVLQTCAFKESLLSHVTGALRGNTDPQSRDILLSFGLTHKDSFIRANALGALYGTCEIDPAVKNALNGGYSTNPFCAAIQKFIPGAFGGGHLGIKDSNRFVARIAEITL